MTQPHQGIRWRFDEVLAPAISVALVFAVTVGSAVAVLRYIEAHAQLEEQRSQATTLVQRLAERVPGEGAEAVAAADGLAALAVVSRGQKAKWGMLQGQAVSLLKVNDSRLGKLPGVLKTADLNARSGQLQAEFERRKNLPKARTVLLPEREEDFFFVDVPVIDYRVSPVEYRGFVRAIVAFKSFSASIPLWHLGLACVFIFLLAALLSRRKRFPFSDRRRMPTFRLWSTGLVGVITAVLLWDQSSEALIYAILLACVMTQLAVEGLRDLLVGIRQQPKTYLFLAPAILAMVLVVFVPFAIGVGLAFVDKNGAITGFQNFEQIFEGGQDPSFYWTLGITIVWTVANVVLHLAIGVCLALALNRTDLRFRGLYRVLLIVPWAVPSYITALLWKYMFHYEEGAVNAVVGMFGGDKVNWLGESVFTNFVANLATNTWLGFPFMMVVTLGALQSIPRDLYEAADIDGASRYQAFRHITLPLLKPALVPAVILGTIWTFNMFNVIYLVSNGGPDGKTDILITQAYDSFVTSIRMGESPGFAAAYCVMILVILLVYGWMTNRITRASEGVYT